MSFKRGVLFIILALLAVNAAAAFSLDVKPVSDTIISRDQRATYEITITNDRSFDDTFRIRAPEVFWSVQSDPLYHYFSGVDVKAKSSAKVSLLVSPIQSIPPGQYKVEIDFDSVNTGMTEQEFLIVSIGPFSSPVREYLPSVARTVNMPSRIDPRKPVQVSMELVNRNPKNIKEMIITGKSSVINAQYVAGLEPLSRKTLHYNITIDPFTRPQKDDITWSFQVQGENLEPDLRQTFEIIPYSEIIEEAKEPQTSLFTTVLQRTYYNNGNTDTFKTVESKANMLKSIFTSTEPKANIVSKPEGDFYSWDVILAPQERKTITIVENYTIVFMLIIGAALIVSLYYMLRSPVALRKEAAVIGIEEEGITDIKVIIHVKNRKSRAYDKLLVADRVPQIASIEKHSEIGTLKASKIVQAREGTIIKWEMDKLEKNEERVFSYTIKTRLSVLERFSLPACTARFVDNSRERKTSSNSVLVKV